MITSCYFSNRNWPLVRFVFEKEQNPFMQHGRYSLKGNGSNVLMCRTIKISLFAPLHIEVDVQRSAQDLQVRQQLNEQKFSNCVYERQTSGYKQCSLPEFLCCSFSDNHLYTA